MERLRSYGVLLGSILCGLVMAGTNQSACAREHRYVPIQPNRVFANNLADGGRLIINRSPILGHNVSISLYVDGQVAGTLVRARTYEGYLAPGRHILHAVPNQMSGDWVGVLDVRRGETYVYTARYNVSRLVLYPATVYR